MKFQNFVANNFSGETHCLTSFMLVKTNSAIGFQSQAILLLLRMSDTFTQEK